MVGIGIPELQQAASAERESANPSPNGELAAYYEILLKEFGEPLQLPDGYEGPFLAACPKNYGEAKIKWMYVGQEGGYEAIASCADVRTVMEEYAKFQGRNPRGTVPPFWRFGLALDGELNPGLAERSFIWSNLARIHQPKASGRVTPSLLEFWSRHRLTAAEVRVLRPEFVLCVTGPWYGDLMQAEFPDTSIGGLKPTLDQPVAQFRQEGTLVLWTYHPNFLQFRRLTEKVKKEILEAIDTLRT